MTQALAQDFAPLAIPPLPSLLIPVMQALKGKATYLALNEGLPKAVIVQRDGEEAKHQLSVDKSDVQSLVEWGYIKRIRGGQIALYQATEMGLSASPDGTDDGPELLRIDQVNVTRENPVRILARKKGQDGTPFLNSEQVSAADWLCEDFRLAGFEDHPVGSLREVVDYVYPSNTEQPILDAHQRLTDALTVLGPDLGDIALRCCCLGEGVETAERRMGWSARSGKIVLRIALRRLVVHYEGTGAEYCWVS